jgi:hypothetical protein
MFNFKFKLFISTTKSFHFQQPFCVPEKRLHQISLLDPRKPLAHDDKVLLRRTAEFCMTPPFTVDPRDLYVRGFDPRNGSQELRLLPYYLRAVQWGITQVQHY